MREQHKNGVVVHAPCAEMPNCRASTAMRLANCVAGRDPIFPDIHKSRSPSLSHSPDLKKRRNRRPERLYERECLESKHWEWERQSKKKQYQIVPSATFFQPKDGMTRAGRINADSMNWAIERFEHGGRQPSRLPCSSPGQPACFTGDQNNTVLPTVRRQP